MLMRSSSIASCLPAVRDDKDSAAPPRAAEERGLARTCSVPLETEEGWRKRKELQSLRRMAAKRRRSEKKGNLKDDKGDGSSSCVLDLETKIVRENKLNTSRTHTKETATNPVDEMPYVFTTGGRLNGRRVDGILYKYRREEEEVRIMCICHGKFHSPTEFIKHAGGADVDHPLRHIVVDWNSSYLF